MSIAAEYYHAPTKEIDRVISFHRDIIQSSEFTISQLQALKRQRKAAQAYREKLNTIAHQYYKQYCKGEKSAPEPEKIALALNVDPARAAALADQIQAKVKKHYIESRNVQISLLADYMHITDISEKFNLSRQQVHKIVNQNIKERYF